MAAETWSAIGLLAATLFGTLFYLGGKIDAQGSRIDRLEGSLSGRIDALSARIDTLDDSLSTRIDALSGRIDAHIDRHGPQRRAR